MSKQSWATRPTGSTPIFTSYSAPQTPSKPSQTPGLSNVVGDFVYPLEALEQAGHFLADEIKQELLRLQVGAVDLSGYTQTTNTSFVSGDTRVSYASNGASIQLQRDSQASIVDTSQPIGLFEYKVHTTDEYDDFFNQYSASGRENTRLCPQGLWQAWAGNAAIATPIVAHVTVEQPYRRGTSLVLQASFSNKMYVSDYGAPAKVYRYHTLIMDSNNCVWTTCSAESAIFAPSLAAQHRGACEQNLDAATRKLVGALQPDLQHIELSRLAAEQAGRRCVSLRQHCGQWIKAFACRYGRRLRL
eukprot:TRINITY_DN12599_c1_g4_i1.p1 TRINITY_DN12599_c1_g4~~TRINITY_DN12599_c1_g4_i1.p1  ORF type:complete len:302 (+),score=38.92 TRINITY_DN12599_c1_g4_i1:1046-1951(+)